MPVRAEDVAVYILKNKGAMSAMKLQKLVYYAQAWSLVWDERPLFSEKIRAWLNGPVIHELYDKHAGRFAVDLTLFTDGDDAKLDGAARETIDEVLKFYGDRTAQWLGDLATKERPWKLARAGVPEWENGDNEITLELLVDYYTRVAQKQHERTSV